MNQCLQIELTEGVSPQKVTRYLNRFQNIESKVDQQQCQTIRVEFDESKIVAKRILKMISQATAPGSGTRSKNVIKITQL
jgi:glycine cleavage system protein P-like pyridoxal-binding family